jgi:murein tripeptide amidase MpaA
MTQQLLSNYAGSPLMREYLDNYDFYIFPIVNPDGRSIQLPLKIAQCQYSI